MSAETQQSRLDVTDAPAAHLSGKRENGHGNPITKDNEWHCLDCGVRVTVSPDGHREYGHLRTCDHVLQRGDGA